MPSASKLGLVAFNYVTITPTVDQFMPELTELPGSESLDGGMARFFGLVMPHSQFTLIFQGAFFLIVGTMVWRRWRRPDCHLLGKIGAMLSFLWMQAVLLGTTLPLIESGRIFPMNTFSIFTIGSVRSLSGRAKPNFSEGVMMVGFYGLLTLVILWVWTVMITPSPTVQQRGGQRAAKLGRSKLPFRSDAAGATIPVFLMAITGAAAWGVFARKLFESDWFPKTAIGFMSPLAMFSVACVGSLLLQQLIERKGRKAALVFLGTLACLPFHDHYYDGSVARGTGPTRRLGRGLFSVSVVIFCRQDFTGGRGGISRTSVGLLVGPGGDGVLVATPFEETEGHWG